MDQSHEIVTLVDGVLGSDAIGIYLHGSSVLGGLRPASDVDVLVLSRRPMDEKQRHTLLRGLLGISGSRNRARPIELVVVAQAAVRPWRYPPTADFLYGEWQRAKYETGGVPRAHLMADLALIITMTLAGDRPLAGPHPGHILDSVPHADVIRASVDGIPGLISDLDSDTRNVLLTLARIWSTLSTGQIRSKDAAADWAIGALPPGRRPALEHAKHLYLNCSYSQESWSDALRVQVHPCANHVLAEIDRLTQGHESPPLSQ